MRQPDNTTFSQALIYSQFAFTGTASAVCIEADQQNWQELLHTLHRIDWCNRPAIDAALLLLPKEAKHRISLTRPRKISSSKQKQRIPIIPEAGDGRTDHQDGVLCCLVSYRLQASPRQATGKAIPWHCTTARPARAPQPSPASFSEPHTKPRTARVLQVYSTSVFLKDTKKSRLLSEDKAVRFQKQENYLYSFRKPQLLDKWLHMATQTSWLLHFVANLTCGSNPSIAESTICLHLFTRWFGCYREDGM
jgi:hypothetical protein